MKELIIREAGEHVYNFFIEHVSFCNSKVLVLSTATRFNVENQPENTYNAIINLKHINDIQRINKFFEAVNSKLPLGGTFIGCAETYMIRKRRIMKKYPAVLNAFIYFFDYLLRRVMPKLKMTKKLYFLITAGKNRVISKAETFGRLYSCGFEVIDESFLNNHLFFVARKVKEPAFDYNPTYGPYIRLRRVGKDGKIIKVYKLRTMHAYSEYLQGYIYDKYNIAQGGKFNEDFRITTLGGVLRKFWLDELPMFINLFKGDLKIVGPRPLSQQYYNLYPEDLKERRIKHKPGLIPPYYADMPKSLNAIFDSERKYLDSYEKSPFKTDWKYFFKAMYNIFIKRARSK
jgi:lipopolysaccharide/colanic/teichoic acid biosynthesis glycosyltransferase